MLTRSHLGHSEDFAYIDMKTTSILLKVVKRIFPTFEFEWLGDEMKENLPLEMDFVHEVCFPIILWVMCESRVLRLSGLICSAGQER